MIGNKYNVVKRSMQLRLKSRLLGSCFVYRVADVEIVANEVQCINTYDVPAH